MSFIFSIISFLIIGVLLVMKLAIVFIIVTAFVFVWMIRKLTRRSAKSQRLDFLPQELQERMPPQWNVREALVKAHNDFQQQVKRYPELEQDIMQLWASFLEELKVLKDPLEWRLCAQRLSSVWPSEQFAYAPVRSNFDETLERTQRNFRTWKQSQMEVANVSRKRYQH